MILRRRYKQTLSLKERLALFAEAARNEAARRPPGAEKEELLRKARQADTTVHLQQWIESPGLESPR